MANKHTYIAEYRMPVGLENPPLNLPHADTPKEVELTEAEAEQVRDMIPGIKLVRKSNTSDEEDEGSEEEFLSEKGLQLKGGDEDSEDEPKEDEESGEEETVTDEGTEGSEEETEESDEEQDEDEGGSEEDSQPELHMLEDDDNFPAKDKLLAWDEADLSTVEAVIAFKKERDLTEVDQIGPTRADEITDYLMENYSELLNDDE